MKQTIERLRERPHDERRAIAAAIAIGVVAVLFIGWAIYFFREIAVAPVVPSAPHATSSAQAAIGPSTNGLESAPNLPDESASSSSYIDLQGNFEPLPNTSTSASQQ